MARTGVDLTEEVKGILPAANGGTGISTFAASTTPTASTVAEWDSNVNLNANNFVPKLNAGTISGTISLTAGSNYSQVFTGATGGTIQLPNTTAAGHTFWVVNATSGLITLVNSNSTQTYGIVDIGCATTVVALVANASGAGTSGWLLSPTASLSLTSGSAIATANASVMTLGVTGAGVASMTFPATTDTVATLAATQTLSGKTLTTPTVSGYTETVQALGTVTSSKTIGALSNGTVVTATLTTATACTFTMPTATAGTSFVLLLKQPASGTATTATFTSVKWPTAGAPVITATVGKLDMLAFISDGTNWYGSYVQGYTY